MVFKVIVCTLLAYFIGTFQTAIIFSKNVKKQPLECKRQYEEIFSKLSERSHRLADEPYLRHQQEHNGSGFKW